MQKSQWFMAVAIAVISLIAAQTGEAHAAIGMMTGPKTGTYHAIGQDIEKVAKTQKLALRVRDSSGSIENLETMAKRTENAALGIVQADVMAFLEESEKPNAKRMRESLRMVMPLYKEEIHILARKEITDFAELAGKKVVVGSAGSGSMMTSVNLFRLLETKPGKLYQVEAPEAIIAVMTGRADAMIFVGGKPVPMFKNLQQLTEKGQEDMAPLLEKVHFLPVKLTSSLAGQYEAATLSTQDYGYVSQEVPTVAVRSVLVSFDFSQKNTPYYKARCKQLGTLATALVNQLPDLQKKGHPKWQEVKPALDITLWDRDECAWPAITAAMKKQKKPAQTMAKIKPAAGKAVKRSPLEQELLEIITEMSE